MKKILFFSILFFLFNCNKKEVTKASTEIISDSNFNALSDNDKLKFLFDKNFYDFELYNFVINNKDGKVGKINFNSEKIDFSAKIKFDNKDVFYTVANDDIIFSDSKKEGYISTNNNTYFIKGYFLKGKFYFSEAKRIG